MWALSDDGISLSMRAHSVWVGSFGLVRKARTGVRSIFLAPVNATSSGCKVGRERRYHTS